MMSPSFSLPNHIVCGVYDSCVLKGGISPVREVTQFEIEYFLSGGGVRYADGVPAPIIAGDVYIARPGVRSYSKLPFRTMFVKFNADGSLAERLAKCVGIHTPVYGEDIRTCFSAMLSLYAPDGAADYRFFGQLFSLIEALSRLSDENYATLPENQAVTNAAKFISAHFSENITLTDIAHASHLSAGYLHARFKALYGMTPRDYLEKKRIDAAKKLLQNGDLSGNDIACRCGFCTQQYFSKVFLKHVGMTPLKYRKSLWEGYFR